MVLVLVLVGPTSRLHPTFDTVEDPVDVDQEPVRPRESRHVLHYPLPRAASHLREQVR